jgi:hypothetical protein
MNESNPKPKSATRFLPPIARVLMGLMFFIFGLNGFIHILPGPTGGFMRPCWPAG